MELFGKEFGLLLTTEAAAKISTLCPDGDLSKLGEAFNGTTEHTVKMISTAAVAMSEGFTKNAKVRARFLGEQCDLEPITMDMMEALPFADVVALMPAISEAMGGGMKQEVETQAPKNGGSGDE